MEYYEVAAKCWREKLRKVVPEHFCSGSRVSSMDKLLASYFTKDTEPSKECLDLFEKQLADIIMEQVEKSGYMLLFTHYNPDVCLPGDICRKAGIDTLRIPHKTTMWIYKDKVSVSYGTDKHYNKLIFPE